MEGIRSVTTNENANVKKNAAGMPYHWAHATCAESAVCVKETQATSMPLAKSKTVRRRGLVTWAICPLALISSAANAQDPGSGSPSFESCSGS
jgi:hypothetical protein